MGFSSDEDNPLFDEEVVYKRKLDQLEAEIKYFKILVEKFIVRTENFSTKNFWLRYSPKMPILSQLAKILINIPASSAFIERFFSVCGIICKEKAANMDDDLIIDRSLLKANLEILNSFNEYSEEGEEEINE